MNKFKPNKFYKYKYSPDDVVFQVKRIKKLTPESITLVVYWLGAGIEQDIVITKDSINNYTESI